MDKDEIADEFSYLFFSPSIAKALKEVFQDSGIEDTNSFIKEIATNEHIKARVKIKIALHVSQKYTEMGIISSPDDIEVIVKDTGIEVINLKIHQDKNQ